MNTATTYNDNKVSPLEALWALFISQPKSVRNAFKKRLFSQDATALAEQQRAVVGCSFKKALHELEEAKKFGLDNLPDASTLFD